MSMDGDTLYEELAKTSSGAKSRPAMKYLVSKPWCAKASILISHTGHYRRHRLTGSVSETHALCVLDNLDEL